MKPEYWAGWAWGGRELWAGRARRAGGVPDGQTGEQDPATNAVVNKLANAVLPRSGLTAYVTGPNASNVSFTNLMGERLPWLIGVVVGLSMALLLVVFRSAVVAVKAAVMNLRPWPAERP
jgi:uncharacterized membrane protein YdfJ with MMPL/SSD domain